MPVEFKDAITVIALVISAIALWRNLKSDTKNDGAQTSEILVKMEVMQSDIKEIKADFKSEIRGLRTDVENLKERVIKIEQSVSSAHKRIDNLHGEHQAS
jgi:septal ring factor EnvC (AmiA/AmiB activator)